MPSNDSKPKAKKKPMQVAGYKHGRVPRAVRDKQILDIAEAQFIEKGYEGTSIESVRLEAGVSRPVIYDYYAAKDKLYLACVKRAREQYQTEILSLWQSPGSLDEIIRHGSELYLSLVEVNPRRWLVLFSCSVVPPYGELGDAIAELRQGTINMMVSLIRANAPKTETLRAEAIAQAIFAIGDHFSRWWLQRPDIPKEQMVGFLNDFMTHGLSQLVPEHPHLAEYFRN